MHGSAPILDLVQALEEAGWAPLSQNVSHDASAELKYDDRQIFSSRPYLQCFSSLADLLAAKADFVSAQPQTYYRLILRAKQYAEPNLGAAAYKELLGKLSFEDGVDVVMQRRAPP